MLIFDICWFSSYFFIEFSLIEGENFIDHVFTGWSTHDDLCISSLSKLLICFGLTKLIGVLSLSIHSIQVYFFCFTFMNKSFVFSFGFFIISFGFNSHNCNLLLSVDKHSLSWGFGFIYQCNSRCLNFVYNNVLLTLGFGNQYICMFCSFLLVDIFLSISLKFILFFINSGSLNVLAQLIHSSFIVSLKIGKFLLFLIFQGKLFVLMIFLMIFQLEFKSSFLLKGSNEIWVYGNICNVTLFKFDSKLVIESSIQFCHHI